MKPKFAGLSAILLVAVIFSGGCVNYGGNPAPSPPPPPAEANAVIIQNFAFNPATLTVKAGTTVAWTNEDSVSHTITSDSGAFDSGTLSSGHPFSYTFNTPGNFSYHCSIHKYMKAEVVVK